jgi:hypothetical protein
VVSGGGWPSMAGTSMAITAKTAVWYGESWPAQVR